MKKSWTYILECSDGTYYTGCTTNLEKRFSEHCSGAFRGYTYSRRPVKLQWAQEFTNIKNAIAAERQIKGWSKKKKQALIMGDFQLLKEYAWSSEMKEKRKPRLDEQFAHPE